MNRKIEEQHSEMLIIQPRPISLLYNFKCFLPLLDIQIGAYFDRRTNNTLLIVSKSPFLSHTHTYTLSLTHSLTHTHTHTHTYVQSRIASAKMIQSTLNCIHKHSFIFLIYPNCHSRQRPLTQLSVCSCPSNCLPRKVSILFLISNFSFCRLILSQSCCKLLSRNSLGTTDCFGK